MIIRIGVMTIVTGIACIVMGWLGPAGPLLVLAGSLSAAIGVDDLLRITAVEHTPPAADAGSESPLRAA